MKRCFLVFIFSLGVFVAPAQIILSVKGESTTDLRNYLEVKKQGTWMPLSNCLDTLSIIKNHTFRTFLENKSDKVEKYYLTYGVGFELPLRLEVDGMSVANISHFLEVTVLPGQVKKVEFTLHSLDRSNRQKLAPQWLNEKDFNTHQFLLKSVQPFLLGIFLFMVLFNFLFFLLNRWSAYLKYAIYLLVSLLFFTCHFGILQETAPGISQWYNLVWILSGLISVSYIIFVREFGDFKSVTNRVNNAFWLALRYKAIQIPLEAILYLLQVEFIHSRPYMDFILAIDTLVALYIFINIFITGTTKAKIIIIASFMLLLGSLVSQMNVFSNIDNAYFIEAGMLVDLLIFSVALGYITREQEKSQVEATQKLLMQAKEMEEMQTQISRQLEQQVKERTRELEEKNQENLLLIREVHHRVKNNLQVISSLIHLKSSQSPLQVQEVLQQLGNRIFTMGLIHEKLYQKENIQSIRLDMYLCELGSYLLTSFEDNANPIELGLACDAVEIDIEQALTCGLICNELMTNSMKYAFPTGQANRKILLKLERQNSHILLTLSDNGNKKQLPMDVNKSFGLRFVDQLVTSKLGGEWWMNQENGFQVSIKFPSTT